MTLTKSQKLLYTIIQELGGADDKIKLAKLQYFSDFVHYAFHDKPISDLSNLYEKRSYGPLARNFNADLKVLASSDLIKQRSKYEFSIKTAINAHLTQDEMRTIKYVLSRYANYPYDVLADITHRQIPYLSTSEGGVVEYDTAYNLIDEYSDYQTS